MSVRFEQGDVVIIKSAKYGPLNGMRATVKEPYSHSFTVTVGQFDILISDPDNDLSFVTFGSTEVQQLLVKLRDLLGKATVEIGEDEITVRIDERLLVKTFGEDHGYRQHPYWSTYLKKYDHAVPCGPITFVAECSYRYERMAVDQIAASTPPEPAEAETEAEPA